MDSLDSATILSTPTSKHTFTADCLMNDSQFDRNHVWHPYTSLTRPLPTYEVVRASGCELELADGRRLVDGMSSWWACLHGYNVPELNAAATSQLADMAHVMFGGIRHAPATRLCRKLVEMTPDGLEHVFLADSGSVAVEVAIKMALQYWHSQGTPRTTLVALRQGYHGDTFGAMSVLWLACPRLRWLAAAACLLPAAGLLGMDYHFLGDLLAGALLRNFVAGIGMAHHAGAGVVPQHARDALVRFRRTVADDHESGVLRIAHADAAAVVERHPRRAADRVEQRVEDRPVADGIGAIAHRFGFAIG